MNNTVHVLYLCASVTIGLIPKVELLGQGYVDSPNMY